MKDKDSILVNQPISREGVLPYPQKDGTVIFKFKRWEDLAPNIGRVVPVIDEHPDPENGNDGLISGKEKEWGKATLKACPGGGNILCADLDMLDGAPIRDGYSPGYRYTPIIENGIHGKREYQMIQSNMLIDHVALTDYARDGKSLQVAGDATGFDSCIPGTVTNHVTNSNGVVNKYEFGFDTFRFSTSKFAENPRLIEIRDHLRKLNPDISLDELVERADKMLENELKLKNQDSNKELNNMAEVLEKEKRILRLEADNDSLEKQVTAKDKEIADLRLEIENRDTKITGLDSKVEEITKDRDKFANQVIAWEKEKNKKDMDALFKQTDLKNTDLKDFDGEITPGNVKFARYILGKLNLDKDTDSVVENDSSKLPEPAYMRTAVYNPQTDSYEWKEGNDK